MVDTFKKDDPWHESAKDLEQFGNPKDPDLVIALNQVMESRASLAHQYEVSARDIAFLQSYQWDEKTKKFRKMRGKASLSAPLIGTYYRQAMGQLLPGQLDISVMGIDSGEGSEQTTIIKGMMEYIMRQSKADSHITKARIDQTSGGIGWLSCDYVQTEGISDGDIIVYSPKTFDSVLIDPFANEPDYSDARYSFEISEISFQEGKNKYGEKFTKMITTSGIEDFSNLVNCKYRLNELDSSIDDKKYSWWFYDNNKTVKIATWYRRVPNESSVYLIELADGSSRELTEDGWKQFKDDYEEKFPDQELPDVQVKEELSYRVEKYVLVPWSILEGPEEFFINQVPHTPVLGYTLDSGHRKTHHSIIHDGVDLQESLNLLYSNSIEKSSKNKTTVFVQNGVQNDQGMMKLMEKSNMEVYGVDTSSDGTNAGNPFQVISNPDNGNAEIQQIPLIADMLREATSLGVQNDGQITSGEQLRIALDQKQQVFGELDKNLKIALEALGRKILKGISNVYTKEDMVRIIDTDDDKTVKTIKLPGNISLLKYDIAIRVKSSSLIQKRERQALLGRMMDSGDPVMRVAAIPEFIESSDVTNSDSILMSWARSMIAAGQGQALPPSLRERVFEEQQQTGQLDQQVAQQAEILAQQRLNEILGDSTAQAIISQSQANVAASQSRAQIAAVNLEKAKVDAGTSVRNNQFQLGQEMAQLSQDRVEAVTQALRLQQEILKTQQQGLKVEQDIINQLNQLIRDADLVAVGINPI